MFSTDEIVEVAQQVVGIKVEVNGDVVHTNLPTLYFVPVVLTEQPDAQTLQQLKDRLKKISDRLADESVKYIDDYFPLRSGSVKRGEVGDT
ncbi:hypothetical protein L0244_30290 [bacterium]|nr:hypothetical protein [bacterium]